jgi:hypothetical protein
VPKSHLFAGNAESNVIARNCCMHGYPWINHMLTQLVQSYGQESSALHQGNNITFLTIHRNYAVQHKQAETCPGEASKYVAAPKGSHTKQLHLATAQEHRWYQMLHANKG